MASFEVSNFAKIPLSAKQDAEEFLSFKSFETLADLCLSFCQSLAIEFSLGNKEGNRQSCGLCDFCVDRTCVKAARLYNLEEETPQDSEQDSVSHEQFLGEDAPFISSAIHSNLVAKVHKIFREYKDKCALCDQTHHQKNVQKLFPNHCLKLKKYHSRNYCFCCLNIGHDINQVKNEISRLEKDKEAQYASHLIQSCAQVVKGCQAYLNYKPCTVCWLSHGSEGEKHCKFEGNGDNNARSILIYVHKTWIQDFLRGLPSIEKQQRNLAEWSEFLKWALYEGNGTLQNLYSVIDYFFQNKDKI